MRSVLSLQSVRNEQDKNSIVTEKVDALADGLKHVVEKFVSMDSRSPAMSGPSTAMMNLAQR